eukprot:7140861-Alexandrium_andersonii.AAC.1
MEAAADALGQLEGRSAAFVGALARRLHGGHSGLRLAAVKAGQAAAVINWSVPRLVNPKSPDGS